MNGKLTLLLAVLAFSQHGTPVRAQGTFAFVYQGRLTEGGLPANGDYSLSFALFAAPGVGSPLVNPTTNQVTISNGLFSVALDFGGTVFDGPARWLEITVLNTNGGLPSVLTPRQQITPAPYSLFAATAATVTNSAITASKLASDAVGTMNLQNGAVTGIKIGNGEVVKSLNGLRDQVSLTAGSGLSMTTNGNALRIEAQPIPDTAWSRTGNSGTTPGVNFLGTTDEQPLELRVNNTRVLRLDPNPNGPNLVAGAAGNYIAAGVEGATISGGGTLLRLGGIHTNSIHTNANYTTIGGGLGNRIEADAWESTISGGNQNAIHTDAIRSAIGGGGGNRIGSKSWSSRVGGGEENFIRAGAHVSAIGGGKANEIGSNSWAATVGGGWVNRVQTNSNSATIGGGQGNIIQNNSSIATIGGGYYNTIDADSAGATISGGDAHSIGTNSYDATIGGGYHNLVHNDAANATVSGGRLNIVTRDGATISGGELNTATGSYSTVGGGLTNTASAYAGTIGGGVENNASFTYSTVAGGGGNRAEAPSATVSGGNGNSVKGQAGTVGGGSGNRAFGNYATVPGGTLNEASGAYSFAAGQHARASHDGSFVWGDSTPGDAVSTAQDQFVIRARGGVRLDDPGTSLFFGSQTRQMLNLWGTDYAIGVQGGTHYFRTDGNFPGAGFFAWYRGGTHNDGALNAGGGQTLMTLTPSGLTVNGTFVSTSDRAAKENVQPVSTRDILTKVVALPIARWQYTNDPGTRHIGPMAQDFHAAFKVGPDDKHIATVDADGVALAAIQGLHQIFQEQRIELDKKEARIAELEKQGLKVALLAEQVSRLEGVLKELHSRNEAAPNAAPPRNRVSIKESSAPKGQR
jgi:trimeric autotransporter adhesin